MQVEEKLEEEQRSVKVIKASQDAVHAQLKQACRVNEVKGRSVPSCRSEYHGHFRKERNQLNQDLGGSLPRSRTKMQVNFLSDLYCE